MRAIVESEVAAGTIGRGSEASASSLTTEYPANGSFFRPQKSVGARKGVGGGSVQGAIACRGPGNRAAVSVSSEFIMVKLLRAYGECLGARSR